jgi:hypothetical protein
LGPETVEKNKLRPWAVKSWCIPKVSTRFLAKMEDVLEVYQRGYDPQHPVVCLDEKGKELQSTPLERQSLPAQPGKPSASCTRQDYEYRREGSANLLLMSEPLRGWRKVVVNQDRSAHSFAKEIQILVDVDYPLAERIVLISDNLNIHGIWSLYEVFPPEEARRIANKIEWHYTPEHGSWLNMAEIELSALERQCLGRRFADLTALCSQCLAWVNARNMLAVKINWQFSAKDARIRLRRLYPVLELLN